MSTMDAEGRRAALARTQLFKTLQPADLDAVLSRAVVRRFPRGAVILRRGDANAGMVVIVTGRVRISTISEDGKEVTLAVLGPGEILGEMSLLDGGECSADATAQEECVMLVIDRNQFTRLLRANGDLCLHLMAVLTRRLRRANAALEDIALLDLPTRLGRVLTRLANEYGVPIPTGTRIEVKLSQKDLSTLVGASREKVNKQLRQWEDDGVLGKDNGRLVIMNAQALPAQG
ncbi:MAG: Crp/Fnr family transcriptional regulator [Acetobacteraceae bacterium]